MFVDVSGGDSILLIDSSPDRIVRCARELGRRARDFQERPMKIRFGGAAGPIAFERMRRVRKRTWDAVTGPMRLDLATHAPLAPHALPGSAVVEGKFYQLSAPQSAAGQ